MRKLRVAEPKAGVASLVTMLREQMPGEEVGDKDVREALWTNFLDNFSVKLDFFETVMYQVQFAASWKVMFDLIVTMAAVKANSNYFQTAVSGGICALLLFLLELYILVIYWRRI